MKMIFELVTPSVKVVKRGRRLVIYTLAFSTHSKPFSHV
jgi:hypothetical protein